MTRFPKTDELAGRRAVVTGAGGGIGRAIVAALVAKGATVHGIDRDAAALAALAERHAGSFHPHPADLGDRCDTDRMLAALSSAMHEHCDILVNNAGISHVLPFTDTDDATLDRLFAVNFDAAFRITRALVPTLSASDAPAIVNIASELALVGQWGYSAYTATKGAILAWSRALAVELAPLRVRVNAVCPGPVDTPMLDAEFQIASDPAAARAGEIRSVPIGRLGKPGDIAAVVAFLASPAAGFVTGAAWTADGGKTAL